MIKFERAINLSSLERLWCSLQDQRSKSFGLGLGLSGPFSTLPENVIKIIHNSFLLKDGWTASQMSGSEISNYTQNAEYTEYCLGQNIKILFLNLC